MWGKQTARVLWDGSDSTDKHEVAFWTRPDQRWRNMAVFHNLKFHTFNISVRAYSTQICSILYNELWPNCTLWWEKGVITVFENNLYLMGQYKDFMAFCYREMHVFLITTRTFFAKEGCEFWISEHMHKTANIPLEWVKHVLLFLLSLNTFKFIKNLPWHL